MEKGMSDDRDQRVKERAYELWENEGRPSGRHDDHWDRARREIDDEDRGRGSGVEAPPAESPAKRTAARRKPAGETAAPRSRGRAGAGAGAGSPPRGEG
jgi:hypothetical protein